MIEFISKPVEDTIIIDAGIMAEIVKKYKGKKLYVTVTEHNPSKLGQKRRQYFAGIVKPGTEKTGYTASQLHNELKLYCNPVEITDRFTGEIKTVGGSTKDFKTPEEWEAYKQACRDLMESLGAKLETEEQYYERISATDTKPTTTIGV